MAEFSTLFREDPDFLTRALTAYDAQHPEVGQPVAAGPASGGPSSYALAAQEYLRGAGLAGEPAAPPPPPPAGPQGPVDMVITPAVERPSGTLEQQARALEDQQIAAANSVGSSFEREGDAKAQGAQRAADVYGQAAQTADRYARAAEENYADDQARLAKYKQYADEDFERLRQEPPKAGWMKNTFNVITGIIGAAAGGTTADALGMLRQHVNRAAEQDAQERMAAKQRLEAGRQIQDSILDESSNEFDASAKLVAGQWLVAARQLEQISNESNVPAFREQALRLKEAAQEQARGVLRHNVDAQIAQRQAEAAARAKAAARGPDYKRMTQAELEALQKAGVLPVGGAEALADLQTKQRKAAGEDDQGNNRIIAAPSIEGLEAIPGRTFTRETVAKAQAAKTQMDKVARHLNEAKRLATTDTSIYPYDDDRMKIEGQYAGQRASALALISQLVEAGVLNEGDAERFAAGLPEPDSILRNDMSAQAKREVYDNMISNFDQNSRDGLRTLGFVDASGARTGPSVDEQAATFGAVAKKAPVAAGAIASRGGARMQ